MVISQSINHLNQSLITIFILIILPFSLYFVVGNSAPFWCLCGSGHWGEAQHKHRGKWHNV